MPALAVFVALVAAAAFSGSRFKPDAFYRRLRKPAWNPPDWVFGPVWTVLYLAIAYAGYLAWRENGDAWSIALGFWGAQLLFNTAWSWLFFGRHRMFAALVDCVAMLVAICGFIAAVAPQSPLAAWLFVPYAAWVSFAAILNGTLWWLNRRPAPDSAGPRIPADGNA